MSFRIRNHRLSTGAANVPFVQSPNVGGALTPKILVLHYTASGPSGDIARYFARSDVKVSAHLVIRRDGSVIQCVPFNVVGWHAGPSTWSTRDGRRFNGLNSHSIGIEIENWGPVTKVGSGWKSWTGATVDGGNVIEARHKFGSPTCGWESFTEAQVEATAEASRAICSEYNITDIVGHDDISPGRKSDPGPAWNMGSFTARVLGREQDGDALMEVRSATGLNLRKGPGVGHDLVRPKPLPDGTLVQVQESDGRWYFVSVLNAQGEPNVSGWVHSAYLVEH